MQILMSMPSAMADAFPSLAPERMQSWYVTSDPVGCPLGSGGGTSWLLSEAWRAAGDGQSFSEWLSGDAKLITHSGGQSRRLPAYAAMGKALMPIPAFRWAYGQRLDQTLIDLQLPDYQRLLEAGTGYAAMVTSGDVMIKFSRELPPLPQVDVLCLGLWVAPEEAQNFGVFFCPRNDSSDLQFFLQKPPAAKVRELSADHLFMVDTGIWLFSSRAVEVLMSKCGWDSATGSYFGGTPAGYELYAEFGLGLGAQATSEDNEVNALTSAVLPLPDGEFYHFGTSHDLIGSVTALQRRVLDQSKFSLTSVEARLNQHTQNSKISTDIPSTCQPLWIENSQISPGWTLTKEHVITGIPANEWSVTVPAGICLDAVPIGDDDYCWRAYGMDDAFRGDIADSGTVYLGQPVRDWLTERGLNLDLAGGAGSDLQTATIFPVLAEDQVSGAFLEWLFAEDPDSNSEYAAIWRDARRMSARELNAEANLERIFATRETNLKQVIRPMMAQHQTSVFHMLDMSATAAIDPGGDFPPELPDAVDAMKRVRDHMFRAEVHRRVGDPSAKAEENQAFSILADAVITQVGVPVSPRNTLLPDQIIWGRSPIRLDLGGGWTDTPPYCMQYGGHVLNLAVNLNGQPPIQVFARRCEQPEIVLRSIDLGVEEHLTTYEQIADHAQVGSGFAIGRAALALAGFLPQFCRETYPDLASQLKAFGGGIELSLVAAVPKGSGLGTSSILAATILGVLSDLCGLEWDENAVIQRTLALEQMLTTGGGWQDQAGGILRGVKLVETLPGFDQTPSVRYLPEHIFDPAYLNHSILLYYTGLTRVAKGILHEIVRGMFLNSATHLRVLEEIGATALMARDAIARRDLDGLATAVDRSWQLNQRLDAGTNPPGVQAVVDRIADHVSGLKLLGAGGGGYMLIMAKDLDAGSRIRQLLLTDPPTNGARFVQLDVSQTGLEITRS